MTQSFPSREEARLALLRRVVAEQADSPELLARLADALADAGAYDEFAELFRSTYAKTPLRGLLHAALAQDASRAQVEKVHRRATELATRGLAYAPVIAALAVCEALLGRPEETRRLADYDRFLRFAAMAPPDGMDDTAFRAALADAVKSKLEFADPKAGNTGNAWFHLGLTRKGIPIVDAFTGAVRCAVEQYSASLPRDATHPFLRMRPDEFLIRGWGVVARARSHFEAHIHPHAWVSGVYYVQEPAAARDGQRGWLRVGPPTARGIAQAWPERLVPPRAGHLLLMPGYFFHETRPLDVDEERISIAFDVVPAELADSSDHG